MGLPAGLHAAVCWWTGGQAGTWAGRLADCLLQAQPGCRAGETAFMSGKGGLRGANRLSRLQPQLGRLSVCAAAGASAVREAGRAAARLHPQMERMTEKSEWFALFAFRGFRWTESLLELLLLLRPNVVFMGAVGLRQWRTCLRPVPVDQS